MVLTCRKKKLYTISISEHKNRCFYCSSSCLINYGYIQINKKSTERISELKQANLTAINIHKNTNKAFREFISISHTCCHL